MKNTLIELIKKQAFISDVPRTDNNRFLRKPLDSILEYLRFIKAKPHIPKGATLLDVGAGDGNFCATSTGISSLRWVLTRI